MTSNDRWTSWTPQAIRRFFDAEPRGYQKVDLPGGLSTPGKDRAAACDRVFSTDLAGRTVLDVGCAQGYFCFAALERGARRAVGWDINADRVRQARAIAQIRGLPAEFHHRDIEEETPREAFDVVLCLNVLHHLTDPLATLETLIGLTREVLVLELASLGRRDRRWSGLGAWQAWACRRAPVIVVARGKRTYHFTPTAMENFFDQRPYFAAVETLDSDEPGRFFVKAHRHRVKRAVLVAGPIAAGKSTLIRQLLTNRLPELAERLEIVDATAWSEVKAKEIRNGGAALPETMVLHYDFLRPDKTWPKSYDRDPSLRVLDWVDDLTVVTLWTSPARLREHVAAAQRRHEEILRAYRQPERVVDFYRSWFEFVERRFGRTSTHVIVQLDDRLQFLSRNEWEAVADLYARSSA